MGKIKTILIFLILGLLAYSNTYAYTKDQEIKILKDYLKNIYSINEFQIEKAVNKTITCLNLAEREVSKKIGDIYDAAEDERKTKFYFPLSKKISYCPNLKIYITDDYLVPDGKFSKGVITLNYNFVRECKKKRKFGIFVSVKCNKDDIYLYLIHEFTHYAFSMLYKNWKFRDIIYKEDEKCDCNKGRMKYRKFIKSVAIERRFFDEFPPTFYSYYIHYNKGCSRDRKGKAKFSNNYNFMFYYGLTEYKDCTLNDTCDIYKVYILGEKMGRNTNICVDSKNALRTILKISIAKEKKIFAPKVRKLIRILKSN